jgi:DNA-binding transcriptional regulator YhcF (GntR family)
VDIRLHRDSEIPLGVQLGWALRARILGGELVPGDQLPGVRELAADTGVNINTVRAVLARLQADGLLRTEHGRGTFVSEAAPVDERLATVARRALTEARDAGIDPQLVAAALFGGMGGPAPAAASVPDTPALRRRALRSEIAALERELADARLRKAVRDTGAPAPRGAGARILGEEELRAQRDALAAGLAALVAPQPEPAPEPSRRASATRPGFVLSFAVPR